MTSPILVTGGTGRLGRRLVPRLRDAGREVRVLSRQAHESSPGIEYMTGDLVSGAGIEAALEGVETIVHCGASVKVDEDQAQVRNLVKAALQNGTPHLVYISVVGADRIPVVSGVDRMMFGYFESKLASEMSRPASWSSRWASRPGWCQISPGRASTRWPTCSAYTSACVASAG